MMTDKEGMEYAPWLGADQFYRDIYVDVRF